MGKFSQPRNRQYENDTVQTAASSGAKKSAASGRPTIAQANVNRKVGKAAAPAAAPQRGASAQQPTRRPDNGNTATDDFELFQDAFAHAEAGQSARKPYRPAPTIEQTLPEKKKKSSGNSKPLLVVACLLAIALLGGIIAMVISSIGLNIEIASPLDPYDNKILSNVSLIDIDISGMTKSEAISTVKTVIGTAYTKNDMIISLPDREIKLTPDKTGVDLDIKAAVDQAFSYGRTGTKEEQEAAYQASLTEKYVIDPLPYLNLNEEYIHKTLDDYASQFSNLFTQSGYELEGEMPALEADKYDEKAPCQALVLKLGTPGFGLDTQALYEQIINSYRARQFHVKVDSMETSATPDPLDLDAIYSELYIKPVNASVDRQTFEIIPEVYGYKFSKKKAQAQLDEATYGDEIRIPMAYAAPKVLSADAYFQDVLGSCETPHTNNEDRNTNLRLACAALDGKILQPGETMSYNETLGERTAEKGYKPAPAYSGDDVVDSIGGGVCQGSSTLYYSALIADLEIVERRNHGFVSNYIDYGMDATVSWEQPDLKIKNNTHCPIKITAEVSDGKVKIQLLGTDEKDYYVKMQYVLTGSEKPDTVYEEHGPNEGYTDGQVLKAGTTGLFVNTYKYKYSKANDELLSKDLEARSIYKTVDKVIVKIVKGGSSSSSSDTPSSDSSDTPDSAPAAPSSGLPDVQPID